MTDFLPVDLTIHLYGRALLVNDSSLETAMRWRGELSPEPETVAWIESLPVGDVFFDIGASCGRFSAMAALRGLKVHAFEPEPNRFAELSRLIELNDLPVVAHREALFEKSCVGGLHSGRSTHTFSPGLGTTPAFSLDDACKALKVWPDHIKLDVDGNEPQILRGGARAMRKVKTMMVEIDPQVPSHAQIVPMMADFGFEYDPEQVEACRERGGKFAGLANHLFRRS